LFLCALTLVLSSCASPPPSPISPFHVDPKPALSLTYLGVAGWQLDDGPHTLLFDPYFTRADVEDDSRPLLPDLTALAKYAPSHAEVILVSHSHYDHLLDVPTIAASTHATVVGTESTVHVARSAGISSTNAVVARGGESLTFGVFSVRPIRALHSLIGMPKVPIPDGLALPMTAAQYGEGGTLQYLVDVEGHSILFIGTANFVESELTGLHPDIAIIAVGLREKVPDYTCRLMRALGSPARVFTNHFDAHRKPLGPEAMPQSREDLDDLAQFADEVHACAPATTVVVPKHFEHFSL
ncbi:MAG: MBL fold metallo-hydrolase, partial [Polyangiales bacterium]